MGKKQAAASETSRREWRTALRYTAYSLGTLAVIVLALFVYARTELFLTEDQRFQLAGPPEQGGESPAIRIEGASHVPAGRISGVFTTDFGRSVYLLPLEERRRDLRAIDWVRDATVSRLWPGRLAVRIIEREPVAFVHLTDGGASQTALIDTDGVILEIPPRADFTLPVLTGIRRAQDIALRRQRVAIAIRLMKEAAGFAAHFSEIDVSDPDNVRVIQAAEGQAVSLMLGNRNFETRLRNFLNHFPEIHRRLPNAMHFDLRLDDRITALGEGGRGG